jgi:hypothetical protein
MNSWAATEIVPRTTCDESHYGLTMASCRRIGPAAPINTLKQVIPSLAGDVKAVLAPVDKATRAAGQDAGDTLESWDNAVDTMRNNVHNWDVTNFDPQYRQLAADRLSGRAPIPMPQMGSRNYNEEFRSDPIGGTAAFITKAIPSVVLGPVRMAGMRTSDQFAGSMGELPSMAGAAVGYGISRFNPRAYPDAAATWANGVDKLGKSNPLETAASALPFFGAVGAFRGGPVEDVSESTPQQPNHLDAASLDPRRWNLLNRLQPGKNEAPTAAASDSSTGVQHLRDVLRVHAGPAMNDVQDAINSVARVHRADGLPTNHVRTDQTIQDLTSGSKYATRGRYISGPSGNYITVAYDHNARGLITLHEVGHYMDDHMFPGSASDFASDGAPELAGWRQAVEASPEVQALRQAQKTGDIKYVDSNGVTRMEKVDPGYVGYLLKPQELFARSYAEYVARKSGNPVLLRELNAELASKNGRAYGGQWGNNFAPIQNAFDALFEGKLWLTKK